MPLTIRPTLAKLNRKSGFARSIKAYSRGHEWAAAASPVTLSGQAPARVPSWR